MGQVAYMAEVLADSPKVWWANREAGGGSAWNEGTNGVNGSQFSGGGGIWGHSPFLVTGPGDGAFARHLLGGEGWGFSLPSAPPTDDVTIEIWAWYENQTISNQIIVEIGDLNANGYGFIQRSFGGKFAGLCGGVALLSDSAASLGTYTWYHLVLVRESTVWTYYLNGSVDTANAGTTNPSTPSDTFNGGAGALQWLVSNPAFYESPLSAGRISAHYDAMLEEEIQGGPQKQMVYQPIDQEALLTWESHG